MSLARQCCPFHWLGIHSSWLSLKVYKDLTRNTILSYDNLDLPYTAKRRGGAASGAGWGRRKRRPCCAARPCCCCGGRPGVAPRTARTASARRSGGTARARAPARARARAQAQRGRSHRSHRCCASWCARSPSGRWGEDGAGELRPSPGQTQVSHCFSCFCLAVSPSPPTTRLGWLGTKKLRTSWLTRSWASRTPSSTASPTWFRRPPGWRTRSRRPRARSSPEEPPGTAVAGPDGRSGAAALPAHADRARSPPVPGRPVLLGQRGRNLPPGLHQHNQPVFLQPPPSCYSASLCVLSPVDLDGD